MLFPRRSSPGLVTGFERTNRTTDPLLDNISVHNILTSVVLPAPLDPSKLKAHPEKPRG